MFIKGLPLGNAALATRMVSAGMGPIGSGLSDLLFSSPRLERV
jgi:hypothetical protein